MAHKALEDGGGQAAVGVAVEATEEPGTPAMIAQSSPGRAFEQAAVGWYRLPYPDFSVQSLGRATGAPVSFVLI